MKFKALISNSPYLIGESKEEMLKWWNEDPNNKDSHYITFYDIDAVDIEQATIIAKAHFWDDRWDVEYCNWMIIEA